MSATQYSVDMEDIHFQLFDVFKFDQVLGKFDKFADFDTDTYKSIIEEAEKLAVEVIHPTNGPGDRQGCTLDSDGNIQTPDGYAAAWQTASEGGWIGLSAPPEAGGMGLPLMMKMVTNEMFSGANPAFWMYAGLTAGAALVINGHGPEGMNSEYAEKMFSGEWAGTMCLTEAGAGTSVGDNRCKAVPQADGSFHLTGEKIFISGGDADFVENVIHLVLAKTPDAPEGTKGLSLFLVPKFLINDDLSLGERNDAKVVGIEHKMGINGSATSTIAMGGEGVCKGWIVGAEFAGIRIMFEMMNEARIGVGSQGQALAAAAHRYALAYTRDRIQGTSLRNMRDETAPRVAINTHPDVRRMLMWQKVHVEAMRSFLYRLGLYFDQAEATDDKETAKELHGRVDLLVPILKSYCSDMGFEVAVSALQCFGGYGYIGEYPVEQVVRDVKIASIYEGTNGIQALDLLGRKMRIKGGALFMSWLGDIQALCMRGEEAGFSESGDVKKALGHLGATAMHLGQLGQTGQIESTMLQATPFLNMMASVVLASELLEQAIVAKELFAERGETAFLKGKLLSLSFYCANVLPGAIAAAKGIQAGDESCLDECLFN